MRRKGTPHWMAPEILRGELNSKATDVWSFGSFAHELATGKPPFVKITNRKKLADTIINTDVDV